MVVGCSGTTTKNTGNAPDFSVASPVTSKVDDVTAHSQAEGSGVLQIQDANSDITQKARPPGHDVSDDYDEARARLKRNHHRLASTAEDMYFVDRLLHTSSAAKKILANGNAEAFALYEKALFFYAEATQAQDKGNRRGQAQALSQSKLSLFAALRLLPTRQGYNDKQQVDFESRVSTVKALLAAYKRINDEKSKIVPSIENDVNAELYKAQQAQMDNDYINAIKRADAALAKVKQALFELRNGDTLVRSLSFDSPQQEYRYEIERNDSHKLLVNILLQDKLNDTDTITRVNLTLEQAQAMRLQAERLARQGDYLTAIKTLEQSTQQIVRAIRAAGVYIPG